MFIFNYGLLPFIIVSPLPFNLTLPRFIILLIASWISLKCYFLTIFNLNLTIIIYLNFLILTLITFTLTPTPTPIILKFNIFFLLFIITNVNFHLCFIYQWIIFKNPPIQIVI